MTEVDALLIQPAVAGAPLGSQVRGRAEVGLQGRLPHTCSRRRRDELQVGFRAPEHIPAGAAVIPEHRGAAWHNPAETAPQCPPPPTPCCIRDPQSPGAHRLPGGRRGRAPAAQHRQDGWAWLRRELEGFDLGVFLFFFYDSFPPFYLFFFSPSSPLHAPFQPEPQR